MGIGEETTFVYGDRTIGTNHIPSTRRAACCTGGARGERCSGQGACGHRVARPRGDPEGCRERSGSLARPARGIGRLLDGLEGREVIAPVPVRVECHSGGKDEEYPLAVHLEDRRLEVADILDRWYEGSLEPGRPAVEYFKVDTCGGPRLILQHDRTAHAWYRVCELSS